MTLKEFWNRVYSKPRRLRRMRRHGLEAMKAFTKAMKDGGIPWTPVYGTLLGAIREKGFIKHDDDLDMGVWNDSLPGGLEHLHKTLSDAGFVLKHGFLVDGGKFAREETWTWHGLHVDIFFFDTIEGDTCRGYMFYPWKGCRNCGESIREHGGLRVVEFDLPLAHDREEVPFEDITVPITKSAEGFVVARYGTTWRIPDPTFVYPRPGVVGNRERNDKLAVRVPASEL